MHHAYLQVRLCKTCSQSCMLVYALRIRIYRRITLHIFDSIPFWIKGRVLILLHSQINSLRLDGVGPSVVSLYCWALWSRMFVSSHRCPEDLAALIVRKLCQPYLLNCPSIVITGQTCTICSLSYSSVRYNFEVLSHGHPGIHRGPNGHPHWFLTPSLLSSSTSSEQVRRIYLFFLNCFWWTKGPFFVFILLCRPSEDSLQWSTIPDGSLSKDWPSTVGWGDCRFWTWDCRFTVWCHYQWASTAP